MAWEERFSGVEEVRDRESRDYWELCKQDRVREHAGIDKPVRAEEDHRADDE